MLKRAVLGALAALALSTAAARAEVVDATDQGFTIRQTAVVDVPPAQAWEALMHPALWWNSAHTFSGSASNLTVDPERRCLCEALPNGGWNSHLQMISYSPGERVIFEGGMGPMATSGATGHLTWTVAAANGHTTITWTYQIGGYFSRPGGMRAFAPAVDGMIGEQVSRLKHYLDTGRPE